MKNQEKKIENFLHSDINNLKNFKEELDVRIQPMRSFMTKNKKEDSRVYKKLDAKRLNKNH